MINWLSWENPVAIWWIFLTLASVVNISFWVWTRVFAYRDISILSLRKLWSDRQNIIWFSGVYVFVCAFRSFLPRADVQRICLFDTWFSSVFVGRSVATLAELAFVVQWLIVLRFLSAQTNSKMGLKISYVILPLIFIAELFSWYAVITTHYLGNVVEESLWALTYTLITFAVIQLLQRLKGALRLAAWFSVFGCVAYVAFMTSVDVPMYIGRLMADNASQKSHLGFWQGLYDLNTRWIVTHSIADWKTEIPWQTLYFTFAVLVSIALCYVPLTPERLKKYLADK
ncbi:MAG: hypothetical protein AB7K41_11595 [Bdellovibrionales bacterium]